MKEIKRNISTIINVPAAVDRLTIQHEWGDLMIINANVTANGTYNFTPDSVGVYSFIFSVGDVTLTYETNQDNTPVIFNPTISGDIRSTVYYEAIDLYVNSTDFFADFDFLDTGNNSDNFMRLERKVRRLINNFTRQEFGTYINKTKMIQGDGGNSLTVPIRINKLTSCLDNFGNDITQFVEIAPDLSDWIQRKPRSLPFSIRPNGMLYDVDVKSDITKDTREFFPPSINFILNGNWGWEWVPNNVIEAAKILLSDEYTGSIHPQAQTSRSLGAFGEAFDSKRFDSTTGNQQADFLLLDYTNINIRLA